MFNLCLNVDHFATLRNARGSKEPNPLTAALHAELAGVSGIVAHLRIDRRHINEHDVRMIKGAISTRLNLEMSTEEEIMQIALDIKPNVSTLVPERPNEVTTEGGLDVITHREHIEQCVARLKDKEIQVSLFIEPDKRQIDAALEVGADIIELNTGKYALANNSEALENYLEQIAEATDYALDNNLIVAAGHSINYENIKELCRIVDISEYNIGHAIISRSVFIGLSAAVKEMLDLLIKYKTFYIAE